MTRRNALVRPTSPPFKAASDEDEKCSTPSGHIICHSKLSWIHNSRRTRPETAQQAFGAVNGNQTLIWEKIVERWEKIWKRIDKVE